MGQLLGFIANSDKPNAAAGIRLALAAVQLAMESYEPDAQGLRDQYAMEYYANRPDLNQVFKGIWDKLDALVKRLRSDTP